MTRRSAAGTSRETRSEGQNTFVEGGLFVETFPVRGPGARHQNKAAGYLPLDIPLADAGEIEITLEDVVDFEPSLQIGVDLDNNGTQDGYLVYEHVYLGNIWASSTIENNATFNAASPHEGGGGSAANGSIQQWVAAFPDAQIKHVGYSLGSGVVGSALITGLELGCNSYVFGDVTPVTVQECEGDHAVVASYGDDPEQGGWDFTDDTRANGSNEFVDGGILVKTVPDPIDGTLGQSKATGYLEIDQPLYQAGDDFGLELTNVSGGQIPGLNIGVDMDNDGDQDGYLVYEPGSYGERVWASNPLIAAFPGTAWPSDAAIPHRPAIGTVNQFLALFPAAQMTRVGYSLGSGAAGEVKITKVTLGCTDYTFDDAAPVLIEECTSYTTSAAYGDETNGWDFTETRTRGSNTWVDGGLKVTTIPDDTMLPQNQSKAAGYKAANLLLADAGTIDIDWTTISGTVPPSLQLGVDLDANGSFDGYLVYEPFYYGERLWASGGIQTGVTNGDFVGLPVSPGGDGGPIAGTLNDYLAAYPAAKIVAIGYSLGSGVVGSHVITKLSVGCVNYTFDDRAPVVIEECSAYTTAPVITNTAVQGWDFAQTRLRGENVWVPGGLRVTTFVDDTMMAQNQSKAAGYKNVDLLLSEAGTIDIDWTTISGTVPPSLQIGVDLDANGSFDGYLVYEPFYYGERLWASGGIQTGVTNGDFVGLPVSPGGDGGPIAGTLNQYLAAYPDAEITQVGYSLGSGVVGSHIITKLTLGCVNYTFNEVPYFIDVLEGAPFYSDVQWLARKKISLGYPEAGGTFSFHPVEDVSRQAMAQFLYRTAGSPAFTPPVTPSFTDVPASHPFYLPIEWMKDEGLANGNVDGTYGPMDSISRQAMAAFLYRAAGSPAFTPPAVATFSDVAVGSPFYAEIEWLKFAGIANGNEDGTFGPTDAVTRQAMAAFLHRASGEQ